MAHQRKLIRQAVVALLVGANTAAAGRVYPTRFAPFRKNELPAIAVYTEDESVDQDSAATAPRELKREPDLVIELWVAHSDNYSADDAMDDLAKQIEDVFDANRYIPGLLTVTAVDAVTDQFTSAAHGLNTAERVGVVATGIPGGLPVGAPVFAIVVDADHVKLASSISNALAGTAIDITSVGSGVQLLVLRAADSVLAQTETGYADGMSDPIIGIAKLHYAVTYRSSPTNAAAFPTDDFLVVDAKYPLVGGVADTEVVEDTFTVRTP